MIDIKEINTSATDAAGNAMQGQPKDMKKKKKSS